MNPLKSTILAIVSLSPGLVSSLQVTPDSPCFSLCIDAPGLDPTDPAASDKDGKDIVCKDDDFQSDKKGKAFQQCMTCLQQSEYVKDDEGDLDWFLYGLRYTAGFCILGALGDSADPNSDPCVTSGGCGSLNNTLRHELAIGTVAGRSAYGYCETDDQAISGRDFDRCLSCVSAEDSSSYLSNFLVALAAGCAQRPEPGRLLALNGTVFSKNAVRAADPADLDPDDSRDAGTTLPLPLPAIVGVAVGGLVLLLLASGCVLVQHRKRRNRQRASGWSFRCQDAPPAWPRPDDGGGDGDRKGSAAGGASSRATRESARMSPYETRITGLFPDPPPSTLARGGRVDTSRPSVEVIPVAQPPVIRTSGRGFHGANGPPDEHATPSSAVSSRSNNPLLPHPGNAASPSPSSYPARPPRGATPTAMYGQAAPSSRGASPRTPQSAAGSMPWWDQQPPIAGRAQTAKVGLPQCPRQVDVRNLRVFPPASLR